MTTHTPSKLSDKERIERLETILGALIAWSESIGIIGQQQLLDTLNSDNWRKQYGKI